MDILRKTQDGSIVREPQGGDRLRTASQFAILDVDLI